MQTGQAWQVLDMAYFELGVVEAQAAPCVLHEIDVYLRDIGKPGRSSR